MRTLPILAAFMLAITAAQAQSARDPRPVHNAASPVQQPALTGNLAADVKNAIAGPGGSSGMLTPDQLWAKIQIASLADLKYAKGLADNVGSPGAKLRSACFAAWITTLEQQQGIGVKDASGTAMTQPDPHVISGFEQLAEVADGLQPTGPLMSSCAPAWTALKLSATEFFGMMVSGAAGLSALGIAIP